MSFGLKNASATYQHLMDKIFKDVMETDMEAYIDDMVVKSTMASEHYNALQRELMKCQRSTKVGREDHCLAHLSNPEERRKFPIDSRERRSFPKDEGDASNLTHPYQADSKYPSSCTGGASPFHYSTA
ncbi:Retrovirus-related Pol polyprotein, partial [Mucuna pruriens]